MGVEISNIKVIVISHDHWDHRGGLWGILKENHKLKVYACPNFSKRFKNRVKSYGGQLIEVDKFTQVFLVLGMVDMLVLMTFVAYKPVTVNVDVDEEAIAQLVIGSIVLPSENASGTSDKLDDIYDEIFKEDNSEDIAEMLTLDELYTKDFKKALAGFLNGTHGLEIKYRDIERINVRDVEVTLLSNNKATVEVEFKVYVYNYGDEDEEEKARVSVVFYVEDLDEDEDYEDAEVDKFDSFELIKFYD